MVQNDNVIKLAIIGSTRLTLDSMKQISELKDFEILLVFSLNKDNQKRKVNSVDLSSFCLKNSINLDESENWDSFYNFCNKEEIDLIITLGDSRIIPANIVNSFNVIGNHGAILPDIQGGASLVWGRILNSKYWGISIMKIGEKVDSGDILKTRTFYYNENTTEKEFTDKADNETVKALIQVLKGDYEVVENRKWQVRVAKHTDSYKAIKILEYCLKNNLAIYLPPRTFADGKINEAWPNEFTRKFKIANDYPYPKWSEE